MRNHCKYIKIFKYHEKFQIYLEMSWEFLAGNCQYWSNLHALPNVSFAS
jgi:hypothetical protein